MKPSERRPDYFQRLYVAYTKAHPRTVPRDAQKKVIVLWNEAKQKHTDKKAFESQINEVIQEFECKATQDKAKALASFFGKVPPQKPRESQIVVPDDSVANTSTSSGNNEVEVIATAQADDSPVKPGRKRKVGPLPEDEEDVDDPVAKISHSTPAQDKLRAKIALLETQLNAATIARDSGLGGPDSQSMVEKLRGELAQHKMDLKRLLSNAARQKLFRDSRKDTIKRLLATDTDAARSLKVRPSPGRPFLEEDQPDLLRVITEIAMFGGTADPRRRSETIRAVKTLDDLHEELKLRGFELARSTTYLRLLPRQSNTHEGKKHVRTVPVRLCRAQTDLHKKHPDQKFCLASIRSIETLASVLGSRQAAVLSQDDKARVPIGITAANKQAPLLMHLEYRVMLPDHDWVVAPRHKLIPSVYAGISIDDSKMGRPEAVGYSGPTYIAIRSGKHDSSSAETHAKDLDRLLDLTCFEETMKVDGLLKPVLIVFVDGGPDENPRYPKVISSGIKTFKKYDLDAVFVATNAPGSSAYNRVERRMAPASNELRGLILPHEHFGRHLNDSGVTIDAELEIRNFEHAGKLLADVWGKMVIDEYPVTAEYIPPGDKADGARDSNSNDESVEWYSKHVRESQYFLQIGKCNDTDCCSPPRSNLKHILPDGFFSAPYPLRRTAQGLQVPKPENVSSEDRFAPFLVRRSLSIYPDGGERVPYDQYCPSLQTQIKDRTCLECGQYFASKKNAKLHSKEIHKKVAGRKLRPRRIVAKRHQELLCEIADDVTDARDVEWNEDEDVDAEGLTIPPSEAQSAPAPLVEDFATWLKSPWTID